MSDIHSVIDLGYGDSGKGVVVDYLCSQYHLEDTFVFRHSGGHQVGHTVKIGDLIHEFHHFGSGTLRGYTTIWGNECTVSPIHFRQERDVLLLKNVVPNILIMSSCPVTTIYDIVYDRITNNHNTVGVGFRYTLERNKLIPFTFENLMNKTVTRMKLQCILQWYFDKCKGLDLLDKFMNELVILSSDKFSFEEDCEYIRENAVHVSDKYLPCGNLIFEGNQGVLLDRYHGFYPHVTFGRTTNYNVNKYVKSDRGLRRWCVTRAYSTRHGAGLLLDEQELVLKNTEYESNHDNVYQGKFRTAPLNMDLIYYALNCDRRDYNGLLYSSIVVTCVDQVDNADEIVNKIKDLDGASIYINTSPESNTIKRVW